jgi:hypothetical protein
MGDLDRAGTCTVTEFVPFSQAHIVPNGTRSLVLFVICHDLEHVQSKTAVGDDENSSLGS